MPLSEALINQFITSIDQETFRHVLHTIKANIHMKEAEENIISGINSLLSNGKTRRIGLELLLETVSMFSSHILSDNCLKWASQCTIQHENDINKGIKLQILAKILDNTKNNDNFNKRFHSDYLSDTLKTCLVSQSTNDTLLALKILIKAIRRFSTWFGNHKAKLETHVLNFIDSKENVLVKDSAIIYHFLQQTGGAGVEGVNHINNYATQFKRVCATIHQTYDELFANEIEIETIHGLEVSGLKLNPCSFNKTAQILQFKFNRLNNLLILLKTMILCAFPVSKHIYPVHVLDVIRRGLSFHVCLTDPKNVVTLETNNLSIYTNQLQVNLLNLFDSFTRMHLVNILPLTFSINKMLLNVVKRIHNCQCFNRNELYQNSAKNSLITWINLSQSWSNEYMQEALLTILLKNVMLSEKQLCLNLSVATKKGKGKGKQKVPDAIPIEKIEDNIFNSKNSLLSLEIIECLLHNNQLIVNDKVWQKLVLEVVQIILDIQSGGKYANFYSSDSKSKLYAILSAFYKQTTRQLPPIVLSIRLLRYGRKDSNRAISNACKEGLERLELISQPVNASLGLFVESEQKKETVRLTLHNGGEVGDSPNDVLNLFINGQNDDTEDAVFNSTNEEKHITPDDVLTQVISDKSKEIRILDNVVIISSEDRETSVKVNLVDNQQAISLDSDGTKEDEVKLIEDSPNYSPMVLTREQTEDEPPTKKLKEQKDLIKDTDMLEVSDMLKAFQSEFQE